MDSLIIYDETGYIIYQSMGSVREPVGLPFIWVEIPEGKRIVSIDLSVTPNTPIFEDLPKSEMLLLQEQNLILMDALATTFEEVLVLQEQIKALQGGITP